MAISKGDSVEICMQEEGFLGSFYEATFLCKTRNQKKLLVRYKTLMYEQDEDEKEYERIFEVDAIEPCWVRPSPPKILVSEFKLSEKVDAYDNEGWWEGIIVKRHGFNNYSVYFETTNELKDFSSYELRVHQDYVDGVWIRPPTEPYSIYLDMKLDRLYRSLRRN
ncbi:hypothetical protein M9H77_27493 [Catharanthus roseus]|uniref:Uncharacterized protein n=1 Tax=Catharanthus roseus TaxID=4058 RepID=A0ACC0AEJ6_CATRO|nr:hypothetical protein M9H77_27493 [Catharanthus roseus]